MTCKRNGAVNVAWRLLVLYYTQYGYSVGWTLIERVLRFSWVSTWKKVALLLLELNYDACSLSLSPRRRKGGVRTGRRRWTADVSALVDISDSATTTTSPRPGDASPTTTWTGCIFFACLSMTSTQDRTTTYRVTTCATATRLSLVVWHVWRFLVRYNNRGMAAEWIKTIVLSSPFSSTSNRRTALKLGTTDPPGLRNTLVQKN